MLTTKRIRKRELHSYALLTGQDVADDIDRSTSIALHKL